MAEAATKYTVEDVAAFLREKRSEMKMHDGSEAGRVTLFLDKVGIGLMARACEFIEFLALHEETITAAVRAAKKKPRK